MNKLLNEKCHVVKCNQSIGKKLKWYKFSQGKFFKDKLSIINVIAVNKMGKNEKKMGKEVLTKSRMWGIYRITSVHLVRLAAKNHLGPFN